MKANAPEKIYFDGESKACKLPIFSSQNIEYTRTDVFIKKACEWIKSHGGFTLGFDGATVRDFLNFINK